MSDPNVDEFVSFVSLLTDNAPDGYEPWLFRVREASKAPATSFGSWKEESARLTTAEAVEWMEGGGNVGIAGRPDDALINVDIDDEDETSIDDLKPTLIARSRSRTGVHAWYFEAPGADIPNIPTDDAGEVRANWQYVVAPGSFVETDPDDVPPDEQDMAGYYSVTRDDPVTSIRLEELPAVFREHNAPDPDAQDIEVPDSSDFQPASGGGKSALFDITAVDVVRKEGGSTKPNERWAALFHASETGENMSVSREGLLHCWRHGVAHNGLQALCVLSDYHGDCSDVGAGHIESNAGDSCLHREDGEHLWHAWKYAKQHGYIPDDDPVPYAAIKHLCRARDLCPVSEIPTTYDADDDSGRLPEYAFNAAIDSIKGYDELEPGRSRTDDVSDESEPTIPPSSADAVDEGGAVSDGGETAAATPAGESGTAAPDEPSADNTTSWEEIRKQMRVADGADERAAPRFEAAMKLANEYHFATLMENDQLYLYDPDTGIYNDNGEAVVRTELTQGLEEQYRAHAMSEAKDHIRGRTLVSDDDMGGPAGLIAAQNCVIDLNEKQARDHSPEFKFLSRLGCEFNPAATAPRFESFLNEVVPKNSERKKLQEYAGYCLMHWALPYHKALFLVGPTASGKSTFLDAINAMLGEGTVASLTPQQLTGERFSGAELHGKWANIRNDIPAATVKNTGAFKEVIGGDPMKAERKRKDPFMFEPTAKHLYAANELPATETDDEAFYRRILLAPFPETIPESERDKHLDDKLQAELPGILNWALEGLQRLQSNGGFTGDRRPGHTQDTWQKWSDSVSRFADAAINDNGNEDIPKSRLYAAYVEFCRQESIPTDTQHSMTRALKQEGLTDGRATVDGEQQRVFANISLTGRGKQLLKDAQTDTDSRSDDSGTPTGLSGWDE